MQQKLMLDALHSLLTVQPGQNKRQLLAGLQHLGLDGLNTTDVNRTLYFNPGTFIHDGATPPRWRLAADAGHNGAAFSALIASPRPCCYVGMDPRAWQLEALAKWRFHGRRGVVEAVTGTGKTTVGVLAAAAALDAGEKVLVLVPSRELLDQWHHVLCRDLQIARVGRFGNGHRDSLYEHSIVVSIVNSAAAYQMLPPGTLGLLVADEVHRYGAPTFSRALEQGFGARLGLTATYDRQDDGMTEHLDPYFSGVVAGCSYERGLTEGILAQFHVAFAGVDFAPDEQREHDEHDAMAKNLRHKLIADHGCPPEPFGDFMASVTQLSRGGSEDSRGTRHARRFLSAFSKCRQLLADCRSKHEALATLAPVLTAAGPGLVFAETQSAAKQAAAVLLSNGVLAAEFHSGLSAQERAHRLLAFKDGNVKVLTAPWALDEGVDVPEAEIGVIMAGSRSKRQMIQRMGRIIRPKPDGRPATFIVLYVRGTAEDPAFGAHEDFREQLTEAARQIIGVPSESPATYLLAWYFANRLLMTFSGSAKNMDSQFVN
ncbi:DEAD/DEAH box helicase [Dactylosporangium sp. CA-139066]|uniref:DEAD/DEAH box helicase n=1 Tax=Dactylosporangium sp. CA-139066 TaxID=3239930 RepID=UPI003D9229BE